MNSFHKIVLLTALVILVLILVIIGSALMAASANPVWPPIVPPCPDWWISDGSGINAVCRNVKRMGTCDVKEASFTGPAFTGTNGTCAKYNWANNCGISWDGITYGVSNPCST